MSYKKSASLYPAACPLMQTVMKEAEYRYEAGQACSMERIPRLALWRMLDEGRDMAVVLFFDRKGRLISQKVLCRRGIRQAESYLGQILAADGAYFAVVHNHVNEPLIPSPDDLVLTRLFRAHGGTAFLGHYITDGVRVVRIEEPAE